MQEGRETMASSVLTLKPSLLDDVFGKSDRWT